MESCWGNTARCTFRTTRFITKNFTSRPVIWDFRRGKQRTERSASAFAGTSGTPRQHVSQRCAARRLFFIQQRSGGTHRKRKNSAQRNIPRGKRSSAAMRSRMAAMSPRRIGSVKKRLPARTESNFGGKVLFADQTARSLQKVPSTKKRL